MARATFEHVGYVRCWAPIALAFAANVAWGQVSTASAPAPTPVAQPRRPSAASGVAIADLTGRWLGYLHAPGDPTAYEWAEDFELRQDASGAVEGTRKTTPRNGSETYVWSVLGSVSGDTIELEDSVLLSGSSTACKIVIKGHFVDSGRGFEAAWQSQQAGCDGGTVYANREDSDADRGIRHQSDLGPGDCSTRPNAGNPLNIGLGNKYQEVVDIAATAGSPLAWHRYYNSGVVGDGARAGEWTLPTAASLGSRWRSTYDRRLSIVSDEERDVVRVRLYRHTGERIDFTEQNGRYASAVDPRGQLSRAGDGWTYRPAPGQPVEAYDTQGRLIAMGAGTSQHVVLRHTDGLVEIADLQGRKLTVAYDAVGRIASVSDGDGVAVTYAYGGPEGAGKDADLVRATYAGGSFQEYLYNEAGFAGGDHPHLLTGIYDETGQRFATYHYDSEGRAIASEHANGVGKVQLAREADGTVAVTGPMGAVHRYRYEEVRGSKRLVGVDQPGGAGCGAASSALAYHPDGTVSRRTGFDGLVTTYRYDAEGNEIERIEGEGTPSARTISTSWHPLLGLPADITMPGRKEHFGYDAVGNVTSREVWGAIDPTVPEAPLTLSRVWRMTYDAAGRLIHEEGPRSDSTAVATLARHTYRSADAANCSAGSCAYRKGDLWKTENALGHAAEILSYDPAGRVRSRKDEHGTLFTYTYTPRGWVEAVEEARPDGTVSTTRFTYNARGDVGSVTDADGITLRFEYDKAGRLTQVSNPSNHRLRFQLDAAGQRIKEEGYDAFSLKTQLTRTFDALGRVETETREGAVTRYTYDEQGRPTGVTDADGRRDNSNYDVLGRLREAIRDVDGIGATSRTAYDPLDQLISIDDPKGLSTRYLTTGLGDVGSVDSPDGGLSVDEHDTAGMPVRHEGAGSVGSFRVTRDALGRPTLVQYDGGIQATYTYDVADPACSAGQRHALGRLSAMSQGDSRTMYCYDAPGNVVRKIQRWISTTVDVSYRYSKAGRIEEVAIAGGARTAYRYDKDGSVTGVSVTPSGAAENMLITSLAYRPFDLIESWRYGDGKELYASRDKSGRVVSWGGLDDALYTVGYTPGGEVATQVSRAGAFRFDHDGLGFLTSVKSFSSGEELRRFDYDNTGDRTAMMAGGVRHSYLYDPRSHRLNSTDGKSRRYDAAGNTIGIGDATLTYDASGRLASASEQGRILVSYAYDAAGQRVVRTETGKAPSLWLYDEQGRWLADYDSTGRIVRQAVWMGDYLVGLVEGTKLYYVQPDHLGSPRAVVDPTRNVTVWRWRPSDDPFGTAAPDEDPDADGVRFVFDLRFPGQRYDAATGLYYNYFRDYDADAGRYIQVDPIGLAGGINPYIYVNASPLRYADPKGNIPLPIITAAIGAIGAAIGDTTLQLVGMYRSGWCKKFNYRQLGISTAGGAIGGLFLPATSGLVGASAVGGLANYGSYVANGGGAADMHALWAIGTGVGGGALGGTVAKYTKFGSGGTMATIEMLEKSNEAASIRINTGTSSILRSLAGGGVANVPGPSRGNNDGCGCGD